MSAPSPPPLPPPAFAAEVLLGTRGPLAQADAEGRVLWCNPALLALAPDGQALGRPLHELMGLDDEGRRLLDGVLAAGGIVGVEQGGHVAWMVRARVLSDGTRAVWVSAGSELAELRARNEKLTELLDLARSMSRLGFWERDLVTGKGSWDGELFRMGGIERGDAAAPRFEDALRRVLDADRTAMERKFAQSQRVPGAYSHRFRVRTAGGEVRQLHSHWVSKPGRDGTPVRAVGLMMDDTETHRLAQSYSELMSQLALVADIAGVGVWRHDLATNRMHCSDQACAILRIAPRADGYPVEEIRALIHPDDVAQVVASAAQSLATGRALDMEARYRRSDGQWRTLLMRRAVQRDADGRPVGFIGVALDVTDRIDATRRAAELARRLELTTRAAGIGYWSIPSNPPRPAAPGDEAPANWSAEMRAIHGMAADAPLPTLRAWLERWVHPDDRTAARRAWVDWAKSGRATLAYDLRIVRADGGVRHLLTHSQVERRPGRAPERFGLMIDVTERRRVELALRQASERAALAARSAGLGTWEIDLRSGLIYWDEQMFRLRGLAPQPLPPGHEERMSLVHPDDRERVAGLILGRYGSAETVSYECRYLLPEGGVRWIASRSVALADENGLPQRRIGVNWDVTDSRNAEAARQEREIARRESQAKSKFLARMSHELRTPLNGVLGFAQLLRTEDAGDDAVAQRRRRRVDQILAAGHHLLSLIDDVLDLSTLEGGELRIELQPVALAPLAAETVPLLEPLLQRHGVSLALGELRAVARADPVRLRQVLLNLLSNAVKYNRRGGQVRVEAVPGDDGQLAIRVSDTGRGLGPEQLRHLFEPFNRLGAEGQGIEGTGIGLAIVKALVERMGGSIRVHSEPGVGSVFEVRLRDEGAAVPRPQPAPPAPAAVTPPTPQPPGTPSRGTILYIEDNPTNALIITELIGRRPDLALHIAPDGDSGVRRTRELRPDLVLLDMQLPDFDGHEVLRRLRAEPVTAGIPVIALSANAMPDDIARALAAGMTDYWTKPLDFTVFMTRLDALFGPA